MKKVISTILFILVAIVLITVALVNTQTASLTILPEWLGGLTVTWPIWIYIYVALFAGAALGVFFEYIREMRYRRQARRAKRALKKTEKKLEKSEKTAGSSEDEILALVEA